MAQFALRTSDSTRPLNSLGHPKAKWKVLSSREELESVLTGGLDEEQWEEDRYHAHEDMLEWADEAGVGESHWVRIGDDLVEALRTA